MFLDVVKVFVGREDPASWVGVAGVVAGFIADLMVDFGAIAGLAMREEPSLEGGFLSTIFFSVCTTTLRFIVSSSG